MPSQIAWLVGVMVAAGVIDPKNFDPRSFVDVKTDVCVVPPNSRKGMHGSSRLDDG